jgi:hypothetical protein
MGFIYHADKITRKATLDVSLKVEGMSVKAQLIINTFQWHAAGVGQLKNVVDSAELDYMGITFPVEMAGRLELREFCQAK